MIFHDAITGVVLTLTNLGKIGGVIVLAAIVLYALTRWWWPRRLSIRQLRMDRITVAELRKLIDDGQEVVTLDVRPKEIRAQKGIIPGAVSAHPADTYSRDKEIVVYCVCPNEESAATAAKHNAEWVSDNAMKRYVEAFHAAGLK